MRIPSAIPAAVTAHDVIIMGGGLAGLTLALQLKERLPALDVLIVERRRHPVAEAAHKVGESTVEIGGWYLGQILGLAPYLLERHLKKFGFRFFFSDDGTSSEGRMNEQHEVEGRPVERRPIDQVTELGASGFLPTPGYQIDRGRFENDLAAMVMARGGQFADGATIRHFDLAPDKRGADLGSGGHEHTVDYERDGAGHRASARWLIDASGRAGLVKRKLDLAEENGHAAGAVWFRIDARIDIDDWSDDEAWLGRCGARERWLSTIHLVGEGYWVWLIPLASGSHSIGIVADSRLHPIETFDTFEKSMRWLARHQPRLHQALAAKRGKLQDFAFFKHFSYGCKKIFSGRGRWALTGEAGVFLDPFYSPGTDFIATANTMITEMIAVDTDGGPAQLLAPMYEQVFFTLYRNMLPIYVGQYSIFGDEQVLPIKVIWDYTFYWGIMCPLVIQRRILDLPKMAQMRPRLARIEALNVAVQELMRRWSAERRRRGDWSGADDPPRFLDQASLPWFVELNGDLLVALDDAGFDRRIERSCAQLDALAVETANAARSDCPDLGIDAVMALLPAGTVSQGLLFSSRQRQPESEHRA